MAWITPTTTAGPPDEALAAEYRGTGDPGVLGQLYGRYLELTYGVCLQYLRDADAAEDATMDIYTALVDKLRRHEVARFRPWLRRLARNHCLMRLRHERSAAGRFGPRSSAGSQVDGLEELDRMHPLDLAHPNEETFDREVALDALETCRAQLSEPQALCIQRFYLEGVSYADLASELGWPLGKVRSAIQNGRRNLRICVTRLTEHSDR